MNKNSYSISSENINKIKKYIEQTNYTASDLRDANNTIGELEDKVSKLEEMIDYFKELWNKFLKFLQDKFFFSNKYDRFTDDLYDEDILDESEMDIIQNNKSFDKDDDN